MIDFFIKLGFYVAIGILLLLANIWYFRSLAYTFLIAQPPKSIAPFDVVGKEDPGGKMGAMLARQLQVKLVEIAGSMEATRQKLETKPAKQPPPSDPGGTRQEREERIIPQAQFSFADRFLSVKESALLLDLFKRFELSVSVGGVDVGGIVAWLQRWFSSERVLRIGVEYKENQVRIVGDDFPSSDIQGTDTNAIVERIAYVMVQKEVCREFPMAALLRPDEFRQYMIALEGFAGIYADDLRRWERGEPRLPGRYRSLLSQIATLKERAPDWKPLLRLNATLSEMSGDIRQARELYQRELGLTDEKDADHGWITSKLTELDSKIKPVAGAELPRLASGISLHEDRSVMKTLRETESAQRLLARIGGDVPVAREEVPVAVLGGLPWGQEGAATGQAAYLADYVETLAQVVKVVTPRARLLFEPLTVDKAVAAGYVTDREIFPSLQRLIAAKPKVLLIAIGPLLSPEYTPLLEHAAGQGTLVVLAAGTKTEQSSRQFVQPQLLENAMIVSAVTPEGLPAPFSPTGSYLYWAPGEQIPVFSPDRQVVDQRSGTGYAAAVAAGIATRVIAENPDLSLIDVLGILRKTSVKPEGGPAVLHLQSALVEAQVWKEPSGELFEKSDFVDLMIPDGEPQGISSKILVDRKGRLLDVRIMVDITHTYIGDLRVWLSSPHGKSIILHDRQGGAKDGLVKEYGTAMSPGLFELIGADIDGEWTLHVADMSRVDVGKLNQWTLKLRYESKS